MCFAFLSLVCSKIWRRCVHAMPASPHLLKAVAIGSSVNAALLGESVGQQGKVVAAQRRWPTHATTGAAAIAVDVGRRWGGGGYGGRPLQDVEEVRAAVGLGFGVGVGVSRSGRWGERLQKGMTAAATTICISINLKGSGLRE